MPKYHWTFTKKDMHEMTDSDLKIYLSQFILEKRDLKNEITACREDLKFLKKEIERHRKYMMSRKKKKK